MQDIYIFFAKAGLEWHRVWIFLDPSNDWLDCVNMLNKRDRQELLRLFFCIL